MRRASIPVCAALGVATAALALAVPTDSLDLALGIGLRVALGAWCLVTLYEVLVHPTATPGDAVARFAAAHRWQAVVLTTLVLLVVALQRAPARLAANLIGYAALLAPVAWLAWRRAGASGAVRAALAVGAFVLLPTHVDRRTVAGPDTTQADTPFIWSVGWPSPDWVLRHEIVVPARLAGRRLTLTAPLAERYLGPGRVSVRANGLGLGEARFVAAESLVQFDVPAQLATDDGLLALDLRLTPYDPRLRLLAHRWVAGGTRGAAASAFFDSREWWPGTFDGLAGGQRGGALLVTLDVAS
jgi:hypothetical protein